MLAELACGELEAGCHGADTANSKVDRFAGRDGRDMAETFLPTELFSWWVCIYAWCTTSRYAQEVSQCHFCGEHSADSQVHYMDCGLTR